MKKILLLVLGTTIFINNAVANNRVSIRVINRTPKPINLFLESNDNSSSCTGDFSKVKKVKTDGTNKFVISHKLYDPEICHFRLLGDTAEVASESTIVLEQHFAIEQKYNSYNSANKAIIQSYDFPPTKCGLGMTCFASLKNNRTLYITVSNKDNQYAHVIFHNSRPEVTYVKFDHIKGPCSNYVTDSPWIKVAPGDDSIGYISNTNKRKICTYRVSIQDKNKQMLCNTDLDIGNSNKNNSIIQSAVGDCNSVISNNKWSANIMLNESKNKLSS
ncbi:MAG: hypothetical protein RLZZ293_1160 [Pseudomonadota bacterium]